jgi:hypothetical protein
MKNIIKQFALVAIAIIAASSFAGCGKDPVTGEDLFYGSLEIINEFDGTVSAVYVNDTQNYNELVWRNPPGLSLPYGEGIIFTDVPVGVWSVTVAGEEIRGVPIVVGLTTTILRNSAANLTAGAPH